MDLDSLRESLLSFAPRLLEGQAGFLAHYAMAGVGFIVLALGLRYTAPVLRTWGLIAGSFLLLAYSATPLVALLFGLYLVVFYAAVEYLPRGHPRTALLVWLIALQTIAPVYWLPLLPGYLGAAGTFFAFATNLTQLRFWGYAYDRSRRPEPERPRFADYTLFMLFFPSFVNGPILSHVDFEKAKLDWFWKEGERPSLREVLRSERSSLRRALVGLALGLFTMTVIYSFREPMYQTVLRGGVTSWPNAVYTYLWWYLAFSAWTEAAIGIGRLSGIHLPENFDRPHLAYGPAEFWRRWNITFMVWLRRYVYLPLGGAFLRGRDGERHLEWRNTAAVFAMVGVYHLLGSFKLLGPHFFSFNAIVPYTIQAGLSAIAVIATRHWKRPRRLGLAGWVIVIVTLLYTSVGHMTSMYPNKAPLSGLVTVYRGLVWP
ncbi:MAG: MBOAT family O-acyltransferase [Myxococcota bacterium]|nr:MBOAT family O-acyltransferase [Myxococcota bacterium]